MRTLNLGIFAHVDAGKTSLTERLLFTAGAIQEMGSVDHGDTQTDSLALERQRGITIKSAVASFVVGGVTVNLIDTPGHPDFIAEVDRALNVLDGAVLVVSAVEGVQPQSRVLMRALQRLEIPTLIFVNKIDRGGANDEAVRRQIALRLSPASLSMGLVTRPGTREAAFTPYDARDAPFAARLVELLADRDEVMLNAFVNGSTSVPYRRLRSELTRQTRQALVHPVFCGSAKTGAGVDELTAGMLELLPAADGDVAGPVSAAVFKVERGPAGDRIAYLRMSSGTLRVRDKVPVHQARRTVTAIRVFDRGAVVSRESVSAGEIAQVSGLGDIRIGDAIGASRAAAGQERFPPPTLETVVIPRGGDTGALHVALTELAEQDPLINLRHDEARHEISLSLYGEVQKEIIRDTLAADFGVGVDFGPSTTVCIERPLSTGTAVEPIPRGRSAEHPFLAGIGLRIDPAAIGSGIEFRLEIERGSLPPAFLKAIEETVPETLQQGIFGWEVTDCTVTLTHSGYWPRQSRPHATFDKSISSVAADFRQLTPLVLTTALRQAGTAVYEPLHRFRLEIPTAVLSPVLLTVGRLHAVTQTTAALGATCTLEGEIPAAKVHELQQQLPRLTSGEGVLESEFDSYQPVRGPIPTRAHSGPDPFNRREYLLRVVRRARGRA